MVDNNRDRSRSGFGGSSPDTAEKSQISDFMDAQGVGPEDSVSQAGMTGLRPPSIMSSASRRAFLLQQLRNLDAEEAQLGNLARIDGEVGVEVLGTNGWAPAGSGQLP